MAKSEPATRDSPRKRVLPTSGRMTRGCDMRVERELMRGAGPVAVLQLLASRPMYGYELAEAVARSTEGVLEMGQSTLYPLLYNLEGKGLIRGRWMEADSGRRRKVYGLTKKGERHLVGQRAQWRNVVRAMTSLGVLAPEGGEAP